jgi:hypothetical protein
MYLLSHPYVDWLLTILAAVLFTYSSFNQYNMLFICVFTILILISIPMHMYFDVPTNTNYYLGLSSKPEQLR